jgi:hypothetical protein
MGGWPFAGLMPTRPTVVLPDRALALVGIPPFFRLLLEGLDPRGDGLIYFGLALGAALGLLGIAIAYRVWVQNPGTSARGASSASRRCTACSSTSGTSTS